MNEVPGIQWAYSKKYNIVTIYKLEITSCTMKWLVRKTKRRATKES